MAHCCISPYASPIQKLFFRGLFGAVHFPLRLCVRGRLACACSLVRIWYSNLCGFGNVLLRERIHNLYMLLCAHFCGRFACGRIQVA